MAGRLIKLITLVGVFLSLLPGAFSPPAMAEKPNRVPIIGVLGIASKRVHGVFIEPLREGLRDAGLVEGRDFVLETRFGNADRARVAKLAAELVRRKVAVIVGLGGMAVQEAAKATKKIPIVVGFTADLISLGVVASLARPGGNVTGMTTFAIELSAKRLELMKEVIPRVARVALLFGRGELVAAASLPATKSAAEKLGLAIVEAPVAAPGDFAAAFAAIERARADALIIIVGATTGSHPRELIAFANKGRLPSMCFRAAMSRFGCLVSYGADRHDLVRRSASHVARILRGANPADLPVERPIKFDLSVNLKTAKRLGITVPPTILLRATEVIE